MKKAEERKEETKCTSSWGTVFPAFLRSLDSKEWFLSFYRSSALCSACMRRSAHVSVYFHSFFARADLIRQRNSSTPAAGLASEEPGSWWLPANESGADVDAFCFSLHALQESSEHAAWTDFVEPGNAGSQEIAHRLFPEHRLQHLANQ